MQGSRGLFLLLKNTNKKLNPLSPNRFGRNFGNLLVLMRSFMDNYRANGGFGGQSKVLKAGRMQNTQIRVFCCPLLVP